MIGYRFVRLIARVGKAKGYRWGLALIAVGTAIAFLGFKSLPATLGLASNVMGWSGVVLAVFGLIVIQDSWWATVLRVADCKRKRAD